MPLQPLIPAHKALHWGTDVTDETDWTSPLISFPNMGSPKQSAPVGMFVSPILVGLLVGCILGKDDGRAVGEVDGSLLGTGLGIVVGTVVGPNEGSLEGV